jgi:hypothetical protein
VHKPDSPYDVAALNNLYAEPIASGDPVQRVNRDMSLTPAQQTSLSNQLQSLQQLAQELNGYPEALLELLQNMERSGGWPYIPRLQLRTFMDLLQLEAEPDAPAGALAA